MQSASFLAYQRALEKGHGRSNSQSPFGIGRIPSDNYIRDRLDEADPALLQPCFERMETLLAEVGRFDHAGIINALKMLAPFAEGQHYTGRGGAAWAAVILAGG